MFRRAPGGGHRLRFVLGAALAVLIHAVHHNLLGAIGLVILFVQL